MTGALIDHLWQSTLFCAAVWSITLALRNNGAALRHWLWLVASLKFLVPFALLHEVGATLATPALDAPPAFLAQAIELAAPVLAPTHALDAEPRGGEWLPWLTVVWSAGAAVVALRWFRAWRLADSVVRATRPAPGSSPDVRITDAAVEPAAAGVLRPVVLLPAALPGRLSAAQLEAVLAHERQHIARRDNLVAHLHQLVQTLFWFHPLVWWIGRNLVEERERACDEAVLDAGHAAEDYAEGILAVCRHCRPRLQGAASALSGDLVDRVRAILGARGCAPGFWKTIALTTTALAIATAPIFAGAFEGAVRWQERLARDARLVQDARFDVAPAREAVGDELIIVHEPRAVVVRNTSLRELVALSYGVSPQAVDGGGDWLDTPRYDIRAEIDGGLYPSHDGGIHPAALRGAVIELLAARFDVRVHVNRRCESPCGRRASRSLPDST